MKLMVLLDDGTIHEVVTDFQQFDLSHPIARDVFLMELIADLKALGYDPTDKPADKPGPPIKARIVGLEDLALDGGLYIGPIQHDPVMCKPGKCPGPLGCWCLDCEKGDHPA